MRVMGIDYGDARTGVAISDAGGLLVGQTRVISHWNPEEMARQIAELAVQTGVERLVVGLPRNMDGTEGSRAQLCRDFARKLQELTGLETVMWDERRTTVDAHRILSEAGKRGKKRKQVVDAVAASLILEGYLEYLNKSGNRSDSHAI